MQDPALRDTLMALAGNGAKEFEVTFKHFFPTVQSQMFHVLNSPCTGKYLL